MDAMIISAGQWAAADLIKYLETYMAGAVITKAEDKALAAAGVGLGPIDQNDPDVWARYRTASLEPETFTLL